MFAEMGVLITMAKTVDPQVPLDIVLVHKPATMRHLALIVATGAALALALPRGSLDSSHDIDHMRIEGLEAANYGDYGDYGSYGTYGNYDALVGGEPPLPADTVIVTVPVPVASSVSTATATTTVTVMGTVPTAASTVTVANITLTSNALPIHGTGTAAAGIFGTGGTAGHGTGVVDATLPAGVIAGNGSWSVVTVTVDPKTVFFGNATTSTVTVTAPSSKTVVIRLARVQ